MTSETRIDTSGSTVEMIESTFEPTTESISIGTASTEPSGQGETSLGSTVTSTVEYTESTSSSPSSERSTTD